MNRRTFLSLASAVLICAGVYAQETAPTVITLEDALRIALSENVSVKVADKEIEAKWVTSMQGYGEKYVESYEINIHLQYIFHR